jgi:uncharacterized LabA/DUF88 family protein
MKRVVCYVDGFNLYHAIEAMCRIQRGKIDHLKWVDLCALTKCFMDPAQHTLAGLNYFSAYMDWHPEREARHREYIKAIEWSGAKAVLGRFKEKDAYCKSCRSTYRAREEKESDVNIATHIVSDAYENRFDQAFLISNDSDLIGPMRFIRARFPDKGLKVIAPPLRRHSKELWALATHRATIKQQHLEACLFPERVFNKQGDEIFHRPSQYDPPK